jgi:EAL and modified HD-GYP domain-containing signal transduction protein
MTSVYLGRQPIIDGNANLCAFDILYWDAKKQKSRADDRYSSASVINSVLNKFGRQTILGDRRGFVNVDEKFLMSDLIFSVPNKFFVFALMQSIQMSPKVIERVQQLHAKEFLLAINNMPLDISSLKKYEPILQEISFIKTNIDLEILESTKEIIIQIHKYGIQVIGTKLNDSNSYEFAKQLGCDWFEGYFFAEPKIMENAKYEPSQMNVLKLYNLLMQDVNIDEITLEFEKNPEVTVQLLQFINSGYFHFRNKIATIHHVLTLVGRVAIGQWLMLMIYSKSVKNGGARSPLMLLVKSRTELMERILKAVKPDVRSNMLGEAYMVGVLSLVDTLFSMPLRVILESMHISDDVKDALYEGNGLLGEIYTVVRQTEIFDIKSVYQFEKKYKLEHKTVEKLWVESMEEVQKFENDV